MTKLPLYYYDLEVFPNCFLFSGSFDGQDQIYTFEISFRRNDRDALLSHLSYLENLGVYMVGFNNLGFDYPIIHDLLLNPFVFTLERAYQLCQKIINTDFRARFVHVIRLKDRLISQIDLWKLNHFDNQNKSTSLKALQFVLRLQSVEDLPFEPSTYLTSEQIDILIYYNHHDIKATKAFGVHCIHLIEMRKELLDAGILGGDALNFSDVKIGTEYLVSKIGRNKCYSGSKPNVTMRNIIHFKDIILPKIFFRSEVCQNVLDWYKTKYYAVGAKKKNDVNYTMNMGGIDYYFGVGGIHGSVERKVFRANEKYRIIDIDVSGMYPAVAQANGFYPEHLGQDFVRAYRQLSADRKQYKKGTPMNAVLKLANNGAYGNSNSEYSPFYDTQFTFSVTVNGQLQLLQLAEILSMIPGLQLIQANTDGITAYIPRDIYWLFKAWCDDWEKMTNLSLEEVEYNTVWIRDVNNYIAQRKDGTVKRKGAYFYPTKWEDYEGYWNKDYSAIIVQKATSEMLVNGQDPLSIMKLSQDPFDFMLREKTPANGEIRIGNQKCSKTVRYYVSTQGQPMIKTMQPTGPIGTYKRKNKLSDDYYEKILASIPPGTWDERIHNKKQSKYEITEQRVVAGWLVKECNDASKFNWDDVDYKYYLEEVEKLRIT
jgi:hypothetical protein